jgi:tRNA modification GTPase
VASGALWLSDFASPAPCELYLWPGKRSYTGQPVAEVHTLGSPPLLEAVVQAACRGGARPAEPGEFTLRAFLAGRIDLTQAEAVLGVIDAAGAAELEAALTQLAGGLAAPLRRLRDELLELLAHLEAGFDFADEDLPFITREELLSQLQIASLQVDDLVKKIAFRGDSAARIRVALVGPPNAGKSSLFNALTGRGPHGGTPAIVSEVPGTTRDYLTAELDLDGLKCELVDTAGIEAVGPSCREGLISSAAQEMTQEQFRVAHVRILCAEEDGVLGDGRVEERGATRDGLGHAEEIVVMTKCDKRAGLSSLTTAGSQAAKTDALHTSALTGKGIDELEAAIRAAVLRVASPHGEVVAGTAVRCGQSLRLAVESLERARAAVSAGLGEELIATEVRVALNELAKVAGAVYTEDLLDRIFSRFCIGK